jgi:hypothetical protein
MCDQGQKASGGSGVTANRWPTPAEIARITAEIRRAWSAKRRARRWGSLQAFETDQQDATG